MHIEEHVFQRKRCPVCESPHLSAGIAPHVDLQYPMLPVCVDTPREQDHIAPFTISICQNCGLITLLKVIDPQVLYEIFHSDGIGKVWEEHYEKFASLIRKHHKSGRILEIGAGQGKLIQKLLPRYNSGIEVIDPMYEGPREGVVVHDTLLTPQIAHQLHGQFDAVISSHTLEHFIEFNDLLHNAWLCIKEGGLIFTSVPNQESSFAKGYGNQLNFEHPSACTNTHWVYLHYRNGFIVKEISFFKDHSIQIVAQKVAKPLTYTIDVKELSEKILQQYTDAIETRMHKVRELAKDDKENWLFGASNYSQPLFVYGLEESYFAGILDNSPLKHNKRLYGTNLVCRKPEEIVGRKKLRVFINLGHYNEEVRQQLLKLDPHIECILL